MFPVFLYFVLEHGTSLALWLVYLSNIMQTEHSEFKKKKNATKFRKRKMLKRMWLTKIVMVASNNDHKQTGF